MFKIDHVKLVSFFLIVSLLTGCGFHLRGAFSIPPALQTLQLFPNQPYDTFQRSLRQVLKSNGITLVEYNPHTENPKSATLTILGQGFTERTVAYGSNGQPNRAVLELKITYQLTDPHGKPLLSDAVVSVERELTLNPNAVLGTDNERGRLQADLYRDAASQLVRQLSMI